MICEHCWQTFQPAPKWGDESRRASRSLPLAHRSRGDIPVRTRTSVFKVAEKMFALSRLEAESLRVSVKCEPALAEALRETHAAVVPGYHLNKKHWNTVILDGSLPNETGSRACDPATITALSRPANDTGRWTTQSLGLRAALRGRERDPNIRHPPSRANSQRPDPVASCGPPPSARLSAKNC